MAGDSNCRNCWLQSTGNYVGDYNGDGRYELLFLRSGAGNNHWFLGTINNNQLTCNEITGNGVGFADLRYALRFKVVFHAQIERRFYSIIQAMTTGGLEQ